MKEKLSFIIISILLFLTFTISIISSYMSYISIRMVNDDIETKTSVYTANLYVAYQNKQIIINNDTIFPLTNTITIKNDSNKTLRYKLELTSIANINANISYTIKKDEEVIKTDILPTKDIALLDNIVIDSKDTHEYTIVFENNVSNDGLFSGTLKVDATI